MGNIVVSKLEYMGVPVGYRVEEHNNGIRRVYDIGGDRGRDVGLESKVESTIELVEYEGKLVSIDEIEGRVSVEDITCRGEILSYLYKKYIKKVVKTHKPIKCKCYVVDYILSVYNNKIKDVFVLQINVVSSDLEALKTIVSSILIKEIEVKKGVHRLTVSLPIRGGNVEGLLSLRDFITSVGVIHLPSDTLRFQLYNMNNISKLKGLVDIPTFDISIDGLEMGYKSNVVQLLSKMYKNGDLVYSL